VCVRGGGSKDEGDEKFFFFFLFLSTSRVSVVSFPTVIDTIAYHEKRSRV